MTCLQLFPTLPDDYVIFTDFNQLYKCEPSLYRLWLRILKRVPKSILWLLRFPASGEPHLLEAARKWAGDDVASRVIFTDVAPKHIHIQRGRIADLFLDTTEVSLRSGPLGGMILTLFRIHSATHTRQQPTFCGLERRSSPGQSTCTRCARAWLQVSSKRLGSRTSSSSGMNENTKIERFSWRSACNATTLIRRATCCLQQCPPPQPSLPIT
jgi:Glycosyl transferase family 41